MSELQHKYGGNGWDDIHAEWKALGKPRFFVAYVKTAIRAGWMTPDESYDEGGYALFDMDGLRPKFVGTDNAEPEDKILIRDYAWIVELLNGPYNPERFRGE